MEKTIKINPEDFRYSKAVKKKKPKENKERRITSRTRKTDKLQTLKKSLMKKIKHHQEKHKHKLEIENDKLQKELEKYKRKAPKPSLVQKEIIPNKPTSFEYLNSLQQEYDKKQKQKVKTTPPVAPSRTKINNVLNNPSSMRQQNILGNTIGTIRVNAKKPIENNISLNNKDKTGIPTKVQIKDSTNITPVITLKEAPPYGILKGGKKPLYSNYRKTLKQHNKLQTIEQRSPRHKTMIHRDKPIEIVSKPEISPRIAIKSELPISEINTKRRNKLEKVKELFQKKNVPSKPFSPFSQRPKLKPIKQTLKQGSRVRRTVTRRFNVGKIKHNGSEQVHVLIKNRHSRKKELMEQKYLKKVPLIEVKRYLRERNIIRVGSQAPEYVLRELYESSKSSGDVENKSSDVLFHNYVNTDGETDGDLEPVVSSLTSMSYDTNDLRNKLSNGVQENTSQPGDTSAIDAMLSIKH